MVILPAHVEAIQVVKLNWPSDNGVITAVIASIVPLQLLASNIRVALVGILVFHGLKVVAAEPSLIAQEEEGGIIICGARVDSIS